MLSGARALNGDHIFTSASVPANAAVIKGVLKHGRPEQLTAPSDYMVTPYCK